MASQANQQNSKPHAALPDGAQANCNSLLDVVGGDQCGGEMVASFYDATSAQGHAVLRLQLIVVGCGGIFVKINLYGVAVQVWRPRYTPFLPYKSSPPHPTTVHSNPRGSGAEGVVGSSGG